MEWCSKVWALNIAAAIAVSSNVCKSQEAIPTDIAVSLAANPTNDLVTGQLVDIILTVKNLGPEPARVVILQSSLFTNEFGRFVTNPDECYLVASVLDGASAAYYISWIVAGLPGSMEFQVAETRTCHFQLSLSPLAPASVPFAFELSSYDPDTNRSNNRGSVLLRRAATPAPTLWATTAMLMASLLAAVGVFKLRRVES